MLRTPCLPFICLPLVLVFACVSPQERFQNAKQLELEGRPADAAAQYIQALEAEPSFEEARVELRRVGKKNYPPSPKRRLPVHLMIRLKRVEQF